MTPTLARRSLRARILAAFLSAVTFFMVALGYTLVQLHQLGQGLEVLDDGYVPLARVASRLEASLTRIDLDLPRSLEDGYRRVPGLRANLAHYARYIDATVVQGTTTITITLPRVKDPVERSHLETLALQLRTVGELNRSYQELGMQLLDEMEANDTASARALQPELVKAQQALKTEIEQLNARVDTRIRKASERTAAVQRRALVVAAALTIAALAVGVIMLIVAILALRPIGRLTAQVQQLAGGQHGARVEVGRRDELGLLAEEFNVMATAIEQRDDALRARAAELDRARADLRSVLDSIRLGLVVVDTSGVALSNPAATQAWGVREGAPLPPELDFEEERAEALTIGDRLFDLRRVPFRDGFILVGEDVTELTRSRLRLARSERLAMIGQMLAQITHEVRNPLNAMSLNAELLDEELLALPPDRLDEARDILGTVSSEIARLEQVTEHYLALARRPAPDLQPESPRALVEGVARLLDEELRRAGVELTIEVETDEPVELDGNQVRRALLNVVRNAVQAGAQRVRLGVRRAGSELHLVVEDDGPGMSAEDAARAFDPFFTTKAQGSGLGLAITRQILEDHAGSVRAESVPVGARIVMVLPA